jgi:hypothetical protein
VVPSRAGDWMPLLPDQNFYDFQLFAPPDLQDYEIYPEPSEGIFFNYDRLYWGITPPNVRGVGETNRGGYLIPTQPISPQSIVQLNNGAIQASGTSPSGAPNQNIIGGIYIFGADPLQLDLNTSWMRTKMAWGNRYEGGWIYDGRGVNISYFTIGSQSQEFQTISEFAASSPTQIFTQTPSSITVPTGTTGGTLINTNLQIPTLTTTITSNSPPPDHMIAQKFTQLNSTEIESAGAAAIIRRELGGRGSGSTARFSFGPRFIQFADRYRLAYESNQYSFNQGPTAGTQGAGINTPGGGTGGTGGTGGNFGTSGSGGAGGAGTGGFGSSSGGFSSGLGGGSSVFLSQSSAGDVLGIGGVDTLTGLGQSSPLQVGAWETDTFNNMVGPEFGLLFESQSGRWKLSSEFKFTAAFNWQNNLYRGSNFPDSIGADYLRATFNPSNTNTPTFNTTTGTTSTQPVNAPPLFLQIYGIGQQNATNAAEHRFVFSPIGEWRLGAEFKVSQAITLHAGYTGMWLGSIARASTNTGYRSVEKKTTYAEPQNPNAQASITNPWVVKTTGAPPPGSTQVVGASPTSTDAVFKDGQGNYYNGVNNPYARQNPVYNRIGAVDGGQEYVFTNGVDFGVTVRY